MCALSADSCLCLEGTTSLEEAVINPVHRQVCGVLYTSRPPCLEGTTLSPFAPQLCCLTSREGW